MGIVGDKVNDSGLLKFLKIRCDYLICSKQLFICKVIISITSIFTLKVLFLLDDPLSKGSFDWLT